MSEHKEDRRKVTADVVETGALKLVDENGKVRAELACMSDKHVNGGYVVVHLYDGNGRPRISLQVSDKEGPSVALFNGTNSPCVSQGVFDDRGNGFTVCDGEGKPRIMAGTSINGSQSGHTHDARVEVLDSQGQVAWLQPE